jgi:hypothetical protein
MDGTRFDRLTLALGQRHGRRRVGLLLLSLVLDGVLTGSGGTAAKKKPCPPCRTRKHGKCKGKQADGTPCENGSTCQNGTCVCLPRKRACSELCCPSGQVCDRSRNLCANPGACAAVTTLACVNPDVTCNGSASCACLKDVDGTTQCGAVPNRATSCNECTTNQDCVMRDGTGAFCVESGSNACCGPGQKFCRVPCPA